MLCADWTDIDAVKECCPNVALDDIDARVQEAVSVASELLFLLSGKQFKGVIAQTIRPRDDSICMGTAVSVLMSGSMGLIETDPAMYQCACAGLTRVDLGVHPVTAVSEVKLDGVVLDPSEYIVLDERYLQRMAGAGPDYINDGWPRHQHIDRPTTEPGTWSITFTYGSPPPISGEAAATKLACELVKAFARAEDCQLPGRVTTLNRQGVSMTLIDPGMLSQGLTGVYETDLFITAVNPAGVRGGTLVWSPDLAPVSW